MKPLFTMIVLAWLSTQAFAWDSSALWYGSASADDNPGGGGILGTGGAHDHGIKCSDCHVKRVEEPGLKFAMAFSPSPPAGSYSPGQRYTITATLTGAKLGQPCNIQYTSTVDNFAASFEDANGVTVGSLDSDSGPTSANCSTVPNDTAPGTTALGGDCKVIFAKGNQNIDTWTFYWTAPASGPVHIYWGAVDGDCDMMSMGDAVTAGSTTLASPPIARDDHPLRLAIMASLMIGLIALPRQRRKNLALSSTSRRGSGGTPSSR